MASDSVDLLHSAVLGLIVAILLWQVFRPSPPAPPPAPGCRFCGGPLMASSGASACVTCRSREQTHQQRMATLTEKEARLRSDLLLAQIGAARRGESVPEQQGAPGEQ